MKASVELNSAIKWALDHAGDGIWDEFGEFRCISSQEGELGDDSGDDSEDEGPPTALISRGLSLHCLRACKQIYAEARHLLYASNAFAFRRTSTYKLFTSCLLEKQRRLITKVNLLVAGSCADDLDWDLSNHATPSAPLLGLVTDLHINYDINPKNPGIKELIAATTVPSPPKHLASSLNAMPVMRLSPDCRITSIVTDMAGDRWSYSSWSRMPMEMRCSVFRGTKWRWRLRRKQWCLTVGEKRQVAIWINELVRSECGVEGKSER
jgi:hypothetical protein